MTHHPPAIHHNIEAIKKLPPVLTISADFAPGGIDLVCKRGLASVSGTYTKHQPIVVLITIQCIGEKTAHSLKIR